MIRGLAYFAHGAVRGWGRAVDQATHRNEITTEDRDLPALISISGCYWVDPLHVQTWERMRRFSDLSLVSAAKGLMEQL
jgi:hypothetical protein